MGTGMVRPVVRPYHAAQFHSVIVAGATSSCVKGRPVAGDCHDLYEDGHDLGPLVVEQEIDEQSEDERIMWGIGRLIEPSRS
jgi:hypothetical protein